MRRRSALPKVDYLDRVDDARKAEIDAFCEKVGVKVKDYNLFNRALSHKSFTNEEGWNHNEQSEKLEFFGDGVLGLIINEYLFKTFPDCEEGELAKIKSAVVSEASLAEVAKEIDLADMILVGRSERRGGELRPSLLADIVEAFIGAAYIDIGLPEARKFILKYFESRVQGYSSEESVGDYKSFLQETIQKKYGERPSYSVMRSSGPDHSRVFRISVSFNRRRWGTGVGKSKKEAEQAAAEDAMKAWQRWRDEESDRRSSRRPPSRSRGRDRYDEDDDRDRSEDREARPEDGGRAATAEAGAEPRGSGGRDEEAGAGRSESGRGRARRGGRGRGEREVRDRGGRKPEPRSESRGRGEVERKSRNGGGEGERKTRSVGGRTERENTGGRRRFSGKSRGGGARDHVVLPPANVEDPIAWAAMEEFRPRRRR